MDDVAHELESTARWIRIMGMIALVLTAPQASPP